MQPVQFNSAKGSTKDLILGSTNVFTLAARSQIGPDKSENEDNFFFRFTNEDCLVAAVADGVGSGPLGRTASAIAVQTVQEFIETHENLDSALMQAIDVANQRILELKVGAATTLILAYIDSTSLRYFCVGDSSIKVFGGRGKLKLSSQGQSAMDMALASGIVQKGNTDQHNGLEYELVNYLGSKNAHCETSVLHNLSIQDTILMGSDGIFDNLSETDLGQIRFRKSLSSESLCQQIFDKAQHNMMHKEGGKRDDTTLLVIKRQTSQAGEEEKALDHVD